MQEGFVNNQQALALCRKLLSAINRLLRYAGNNCSTSTGSWGFQDGIAKLGDIVNTFQDAIAKLGDIANTFQDGIAKLGSIAKTFRGFVVAIS